MASTWWTQLDQLDEAQAKVISLSTDDDHLVLGPPGSGKTNLLLLRASYLHKAGIQDITVLTFGRVLREFLASGADNYAFSSDKVQTYVRWASQLLRANGQVFDPDADLDAVRAAMLSGLKTVAHKNDPANICDCILIDEVQDYTADEVAVIQTFAKHVFLVGDGRQMIYVNNGSVETLRKQMESVTLLPYHYRNGTKICRLADGIMNTLDSADGMEATCNYDENKYPSSVVEHGGLAFDHQVSAAAEAIVTQLRAYPDELIGIICPRSGELDQAAAALAGSPIASEIVVQKQGGYSSFRDKRVVLTSLHGAKGLEFRTVHILGAEFIKRFPLQKKMAFTAVTRAKTSVTVYYDGALPGYLEKGIAAALGKSASKPPLTALFGKRD